ncbi:hypothetical protein M9Y10_004910 [Tritrichomonas musculus]|uniref:Uncharacterized protein n=1 Tax=Tritrichomonas musculus TaxID=1915356 RepID=A0ABR2JJU3_9EUKA
MTESLVRIQFDETSLIGRFSGVDSKLNHHEEMILELQKLLKDFQAREVPTSSAPNYDDKIKELDEKNKNFEIKINEMNLSISELEKKLNAVIKDISDVKSNFEDRLSQLSDFFNIKFRQQYEELSGLIPRDSIKQIDYEDRIKICENNIQNNKESITKAQSSVLQIASSMASLINQKASLDDSLSQTMDTSMYYVKSNFEQLYSELNKLKDHINLLSSSENSKGATISPRPQILSPRVLPTPIQTSSRSTKSEEKSIQTSSRSAKSEENPIQTSSRSNKSDENPVQNEEKNDQNQYNNLMEKQKAQLNQQPMILNINKPVGNTTVVQHEVVSKPPYDLSTVRPYPSMKVNWQDKPELPPIRQFINLEEAIDYIYRVQPPIQAYLEAMHKKIVADSSKIEDKIDKDAVHKMFQKIQSIIGELRSHIDGLKKNIENTATRDEINDIFEDLIAETRNNENQTAIGRVRCIACGREMSQVAGAMTEAELSRALGMPPNSLALRSGVSTVGVSYNSSSRGKMDSEIVESPRSVRPFKQKRMKAMIKPI